MWHGQHFLVPFVKRAEHRAKVLISRHRDGEINAIAVERLGFGTIRGSGAHGAGYARKGGVAAFKEMLAALEEGYSLALTADVPKVSRVAGLGIVMLARACRAGRSFRSRSPPAGGIELNNWDRSAVNLPFGRGAIVAGDLIRVPARRKGRVSRPIERRSRMPSIGSRERAYDIVDRQGSPKPG